MKTSELAGAALDWAVAKCEGWGCYPGMEFQRLPKHFKPSTDWAQGGPIIDRELLYPNPLLDENCAAIGWECRNWKGDGMHYSGPTALVAAMRCYAASKLGDEIEIPKEFGASISRQSR